MRKALSVTLQETNVLWLRGQAAASAKGSVSDLLDRRVTEARVARQIDPGAIRSVQGTIDLPDDDAHLAQSDAYVRSLFDASLRRPVLVKEVGPTYGKRAPKKARRRG